MRILVDLLLLAICGSRIDPFKGMRNATLTLRLSTGSPAPVGVTTVFKEGMIWDNSINHNRRKVRDERKRIISMEGSNPEQSWVKEMAKFKVGSL